MNGSPAGSDPERIGAYQVQAQLGKGGMGEVYLAWDERLERHVALKRLRVDTRGAERARLQREARAIARLSHPAIVRIYDVLDAADEQYLVMEYIEGPTLTELVNRRQIDLRHAVDLAREIAEGLVEAHTKGLVHRDLKSENVIVTPAGHARILDFGLARLLWQSGDGAPSEPLTGAGVLVGTVHAMSPEQATRRTVDHRSDLFSFGILIYEMLTGRSPFRGETPFNTLHRIVYEDPTPLLDLRPDLPPELADLVHRLLAKDRDHRPQNARLVAMELQELELPEPELAGAAAPARATDPTRTRLPRPVAPDSPTVSAIRLEPTCTLPGDFVSPGAESAGPSPPEPRTLVLTALVDGRRRIEELDESRGAEVRSRHDRMARDLAARWDAPSEGPGHGVVEVDGGEGLFFLFERAVDAVSWVLAYHRGVAELAETFGVELQARAAVHLGEVVLRRNSPSDVARGARPFEVEGDAQLTAHRVLSLAAAGQTLLTESAFDLARRDRDSMLGEIPRWLAHGRYFFRDLDEPMEIFEVGTPGFAALTVPPDTEHARRAVAFGEEITLGWRPAAGQAIPRRPHWKLVERLGKGGFGETWLVAHPAGEKRVFKFCFEAERLGALKREVTLFRLLRDALGQRDDIARILSWNFDVAPYFLESEYTEGGDLTRWAEEQGGLAAVSRPTRLELVAGVAEALHAAHSVGILHKDVKPGNILITVDPEGCPRPRLADFGLGLLTERERLASHGITALGFSATESSPERSSGGTWQYMAPELTEGKPATIQADVYSLGVVLYQIVVGDFRRSLAPGWRRDVDDELLTEDIAALVDGSPDRRPASALEVAERLRHLDERRERRRAERRAAREAARAARRRRLITAVAVLSTLVLGIVSVLAITASRARDEARLRRQQSAKLIDFMLSNLRPKIEKKTGSLAILDEVGEKAMDYFAAIPPADFTPSELLSHPQALRQIGDVRLQRGDLQGATEVFQKSLALADNLARRDLDNSDWQLSLAASHFYVGYFFLRVKDLEKALVHFQAYHDIAERWVALAPDDETWQLELAYAHSNIASVLIKTSDPDGALRHLETSAGLMESFVARQPESSRYQLDLSHVYSKMATGLRAQGKLNAALELQQKALGIHRSLVESEPDNFQRLRYLATTHNHLGDLLQMLGQPRRALEQLRADLELARRLADQDPENSQWRQELGISHGEVGAAHRALGELGSAEDQFRIQLAIFEDLTRGGPNRPQWRTHLARSHTSLASVLVLQGSQAARRHLEQALAIFRPMAQEQPGDAEAHRFLSTSLWLLGRIDAGLGDLVQRTGPPPLAAASPAGGSWRDGPPPGRPT